MAVPGIGFCEDALVPALLVKIIKIRLIAKVNPVAFGIPPVGEEISF